MERVWKTCLIFLFFLLQHYWVPERRRGVWIGRHPRFLELGFYFPLPIKACINRSFSYQIDWNFDKFITKTFIILKVWFYLKLKPCKIIKTSDITLRLGHCSISWKLQAKREVNLDPLISSSSNFSIGQIEQLLSNSS